MTGLEKIIERILADGTAQSDQILADAKKKADQILADGKQAAETAYAEQLKALEQQTAFEREKIATAAEAAERRQILSARADLVQEVISDAEERLQNLSGKDYFDTLAKLIAQYRTGKSGELLLRAEDIAALPKDFLKPFSELKPVAAKVGKGFILRYGGVEQNCTFSALMQSKKEQIKDMLAKMLF